MCDGSKCDTSVSAVAKTLFMIKNLWRRSLKCSATWPELINNSKTGNGIWFSNKNKSCWIKLAWPLLIPNLFKLLSRKLNINCSVAQPSKNKSLAKHSSLYELITCYEYVLKISCNKHFLEINKRSGHLWNLFVLFYYKVAHVLKFKIC